jgi:Raf kinase inhibitor-like YbhB/YbcL family protein
MKLTSTAFENDSTIDAKFTVEGEDISPPLAWSGAPANTVSFALICDDPDAPTRKRPAEKPWVHWILFDIPADAVELPAGIPRQGELSQFVGARHGANSWSSGSIGYRGPAPPPGSGPHRYFFKLYALDTKLKLDAGATKEQLLAAMSGHVLAEGELMGIYER